MGLYKGGIVLFFCIEIFGFIIAIKTKNKKMWLAIIVMLFSFLYAKMTENYYDSKFIDYENNYIVKIISLPEEVKNYSRYTATVKTGKYKHTKILVYSKKDFEYGDVIKFSQEIELPDGRRNDMGFDYSIYLRGKKISGIVKLKDFQLITEERDCFIYLFKLKKILLKRIEGCYSERESGFLKAILFGETNEIEEDIKEVFKEANISHVLAISGMHVTYIVLGIETILKKFVKDIKVRNFLIILFLNIFAIFVGGSNSVWRACIMMSIVYLGNIVLRKANFWNSFKLALSILLLMNPYNIFSGAMWLSFGGSLGIVLYSKLLEKLMLKRIKKINFRSNAFFEKIINKLITTISVTLGAQIIVFPIMIYVFNTFSLNFILSNVLISELVGPILILGYLCLLFPFLSFIEKILIKTIIMFAMFSSKLPISNIAVATPNLYKIILYYIFLAMLLYLYKKRKLLLVRKIRKFGLKTGIIIIIVLCILFGNFQIPYRRNFEIHFLDVNQGDSCFIRTANNVTILIDGGKGSGEEYDYGKNVLSPYLLDHGITKIDYMICSHFDVDHCGGLFYILDNFQVENVVIGKQFDEYPNLIAFLELAKEKHNRLTVLEAGDIIKFDKDTKGEVLFPSVENKISDNEINNNSLVVKLYYRDISILFTGDIEEEAERKLVDIYGNKLNSDILKVGHHGSKTSSTEDFIECVTPKISLIGVGKNNNFGHPNIDVIERLNNFGKVYRTDQMGEIIITINRKKEIKIAPMYGAILNFY